MSDDAVVAHEVCSSADSELRIAASSCVCGWSALQEYTPGQPGAMVAALRTVTLRGNTHLAEAGRAGRRAYLDNMERIIAEHGWAVQGVYPAVGDMNPPGSGFSYTVGLTPAGCAELVVSGLSYMASGGLLNDAARRHLFDELSPGMVVEGIATVPLVVIDAPTAGVVMARELYGFRVGAVRCVQLVWPDDGGAYPWDRGWSLPADAQPLYGKRAAA